MVGEGFVRECHFCWDLRTKSQPFMGQPSEECSGSRHSMCKGPVSTSCCLVAFLTFTVEASLFSAIFNEFSFYLHISHFNLMPFLISCQHSGEYLYIVIIPWSLILFQDSPLHSFWVCIFVFCLFVNFVFLPLWNFTTYAQECFFISLSEKMLVCIYRFSCSLWHCFNS